MINPHLIEATYLRINDRSRVRKFYRAAFGSHGKFRPCRHQFQTATLARQHAQSVHRRWAQLYDAAILTLVSQV